MNCSVVYITHPSAKHFFLKFVKSMFSVFIVVILLRNSSYETLHEKSNTRCSERGQNETVKRLLTDVKS